MRAISLQSGSNGNCIYLETCGVKLLFDAGISGIDAEQRLAAHGLGIRDVDALILSHDHADHSRFAGVYQRKYGLPLFVTQKTLDRTAARHRLGRIKDISYFRAGETLLFGDVSVDTVPTPHDGIDGVAFVISAAGKRLGILTDLGHAFKGLFPLMESLDAVFLESNYDPGMLAKGPYPYFLKERIRGPRGHLSNLEAAKLLEAGKGLKWACLSHLSEQNNTPELALRTHREVLREDLVLHTASRFEASGIFSV